jgi:hypothetical protein
MIGVVEFCPIHLNLWRGKGKKCFPAEFRGATGFKLGYEPKSANFDPNRVLSK